MAESDTFEFTAWCNEFELTEDTVTLLETKGFKSYKALSLVPLDIIKNDRDFKALIPGQQVLLRAGFELLKPQPPKPKAPALPALDATSPQGGIGDPPAAATAAAKETSNLPNNMTVDEVMALWQATPMLQTHSPANPTPLHMPPQPPSDPFGFGTGPYKGKKLRKINDYITNINSLDPTYDAEETMNIGGVEFAVGRGKKLPMGKVNLPHYMEGSLRVLREMMLEEHLPTEQVIHYVNYLIQIACLAQSKKPWPQILSYDTIYRREQHQQGFAWGTGSSFLLSSHFTSANPTTTTTPANTHDNTSLNGNRESKKAPLRQVIYPPTGRPVCGRFNSREGCHYHACTFEHVCKTCMATDHSQQLHFAQAHKPDQPKN